MNTYSDGYTIHHRRSPMTLHHACQPPIHLSAKWPVSPWLSAAAIMIMYFSTALPSFSPYFLFQPKMQQRVQQWDSSWSTWAAKCQVWQVLSHHKHQCRSPTFSLRDYKPHTFPLYISWQCLLTAPITIKTHSRLLNKCLRAGLRDQVEWG